MTAIVTAVFSVSVWFALKLQGHFAVFWISNLATNILGVGEVYVLPSWMQCWIGMLTYHHQLELSPCYKVLSSGIMLPCIDHCCMHGTPQLGVHPVSPSKMLRVAPLQNLGPTHAGWQW